MKVTWTSKSKKGPLTYLSESYSKAQHLADLKPGQVHTLVVLKDDGNHEDFKREAASGVHGATAKTEAAALAAAIDADGSATISAVNVVAVEADDEPPKVPATSQHDPGFAAQAAAREAAAREAAAKERPAR